MTSLAIDHPDVVDVSATGKLVYLVLRHHGPCSRAELRRRTGESDRSLDTALEHLRDVDVLLEDAHPGDARKRQYDLADTPRK